MSRDSTRRPRPRALARSDMKNRTGLSLAIVVLAVVPALADPPTHEWSMGLGGASGDEGRGVAVDGSGNTYVTGTFASTVDFGGGPLTSTGSRDAFLAKYDPNGNHLWSRNFGGTSSDEANAIAVDIDGNVVIIGQFWGTANFGGVGSLVSNGADDVFVAKYGANGAHLWSRGFGGTSGDDGRSVVVDGDGNVLVTGFFVGTADLGGGNLTAAGGGDVFLAKYDPVGTHLWSQAHGGSGNEIGNTLATDDSGRVLLIGQFDGTASFGGANLTSAGQQDTFVAKYDAGGAHQWSQRFGNIYNCIGLAVATDGAGSVLIAGHFTGNVDFGGGILMGWLGTNVFLAKYDAAGTHLWSKTFGASSTTDIGYGLAVDAADHVYMTGYFEDTVDFGGGPVTGGGTHDVFIARFDPSGGHQWSRGFGTTMYQEGRSLTVDGAGHVIVTGFFANSVDFGGGPILSEGGNDVFLTRFDGGGSTTVARYPRDDGALSTAVYPNPFRSHTTLEFTLPHSGRVKIDIYDVRGSRVATLLDGNRSASRLRTTWTGRDDTGRRVGPGVYLVRYRLDGATWNEKLVMLD